MKMSNYSPLEDMALRPGSPSLSQRIIRFSISGVLATAVHVLIAATLIQLLAVHPASANAAAVLGATFFSYVVNTLWSFARPLRGRTLSRFLMVSAGICGLASGVSWLVEWYGVNYWIGILCVISIIPPITFSVHNLWTYR
jgi:putative flippase GtrA